MFIKLNHSIFHLAIFMLLFGNSCNNPQPQATNNSGPQFSSPKVKTAFKEVMEIHDEVMPFISDMKRDKRQLENQALVEASSPEEKKELQDAIKMLVAGDSLMFDWMENFRTPDPETPETEALTYLTSEKEKVLLVSKTMKVAMKRSKELLKQQ